MFKCFPEEYHHSVSVKILHAIFFSKSEDELAAKYFKNDVLILNDRPLQLDNENVNY